MNNPYYDKTTIEMVNQYLSKTPKGADSDRVREEGIREIYKMHGLLNKSYN